MKRYTQEDVEELVRTARGVEAAIARNVRLSPGGSWQEELQIALKPFLPDPEDELVEAMAVEMFNTWHRNGDERTEAVDISPSVLATYMGGCRKILSVLKDRGLIKELS